MKTRNVVVLLVSLVVFTNCFAQKESKKDKKDKNATETAVAPEAPQTPQPPVVTDTPECQVNISLFNESAKNKQFADALAPWNAAYEQCPGANKAIYSRGRDILHWELAQAKDAATYDKVFKKLMGMYDNRIKYFGDDEKYPTPWILGLKGLDYIVYVKNDELKKPAYEWLEKSIDGLKEKTEYEVMRNFIVLSNGLYKADPNHAEKYIADYLKVNAILETLAAGTDPKDVEIASQLKAGLDGLFVQSGVADCKTLDNLYKDKVQQNLSNADFLANVVGFYKRIRCTESDVYFTAAVAAHKIQPTAESANACAEMSVKKNEYTKAIAFYEEATRLTSNKLDKADYQYKIAQLYSNLDSYSRAREAARNSLEYNPNNGKPYILIGKLYAGSSIYDDPVLRKTVYWAAVDKFSRAKQVDASCADEANDLIRRYSPHFPTKEEMFFKPEIKAGSSFFVGGWIGESTTCR
ncbi:MAG: hypothetical protein H6Q20_1994 [Bacteroidetes bacterium]|nr:hypothetical protein [Bacteroidota bacterium]